MHYVNNAVGATAIESRSTEPETTVLLEPDNLYMPTVYYTEEVWATIRYLVDKCPDEIGWLGLVDYDGADYLVTEIFVPKQKVSGAETDITAETMSNLALEIDELGKDISKLYYWGHSHVNMGVSPSGQDESQVESYLFDKDFNPIVDTFIRGIYNKQGRSKVDVYDTVNNVVHQCVNNHIHMPSLSKDHEKKLDQLMKKNVSKAIYNVPRKKPVQQQRHLNNGYPWYQDDMYTPWDDDIPVDPIPNKNQFGFLP